MVSLSGCRGSMGIGLHVSRGDNICRILGGGGDAVNNARIFCLEL